MRSIPRLVHMLGLAAFAGTVFVHILIVSVADPAEPQAYAGLMAFKDTTTKVLLIPGVALLGLSGMAMLRRLPRPLPLWLKVKLALVPVIAVNGLFVLLPVGMEIAKAAAAGPVPPHLLLREAIAGTLNLVLILAVVALSALRPAFGRGASRREVPS